MQIMNSNQIKNCLKNLIKLNSITLRLIICIFDSLTNPIELIQKNYPHHDSVFNNI